MQRDLAEEAVAALKSVHGTVYQPINSAGLCKMIEFVSTICTKYLNNLKISLLSFELDPVEHKHNLLKTLKKKPL